VHIESSEEERIKRYIADGNSKEDYDKANAHHVEMEIYTLTSLAHVVIHNGNDIVSLQQQIAKIAKFDSKLK
jgi:dephospho-CoA kinase